MSISYSETGEVVLSPRKRDDIQSKFDDAVARRFHDAGLNKSTGEKGAFKQLESTRNMSVTSTSKIVSNFLDKHSTKGQGGIKGALIGLPNLLDDDFEVVAQDTQKVLLDGDLYYLAASKVVRAFPDFSLDYQFTSFGDAPKRAGEELDHLSASSVCDVIVTIRAGPFTLALPEITGTSLAAQGPPTGENVEINKVWLQAETRGDKISKITVLNNQTIFHHVYNRAEYLIDQKNVVRGSVDVSNKMATLVSFDWAPDGASSFLEKFAIKNQKEFFRSGLRCECIIAGATEGTNKVVLLILHSESTSSKVEKAMQPRGELFAPWATEGKISPKRFTIKQWKIEKLRGKDALNIVESGHFVGVAYDPNPESDFESWAAKKTDDESDQAFHRVGVVSSLLGSKGGNVCSTHVSTKKEDFINFFEANNKKLPTDEGYYHSLFTVKHVVYFE